MDNDGLGETFGKCLGVFYDEYGMVISCKPDWMQNVMNVLVGLFRRYGLAENFAKSRTMICQPGALQAGMSEEAMVMECTGVVDSYWVRLRRRIPLPECIVDITSGYMTSHRFRMQVIDPTIDWSWLPVIQTEHQPQLYNVRFSRSKKCRPRPFPGCPGSYHTWNGLRLHLNRQYWGNRIKILDEQPNPLPRCERYGSQVPAVG